jgi:TnpA family transposase
LFVKSFFVKRNQCITTDFPIKRKNKLYFAFRELGSVARTAFLLEYITDKNLRRNIQGSTNKCKLFNNFAGWIYFADSMIRENVRDEQGLPGNRGRG